MEKKLKEKKKEKASIEEAIDLKEAALWEVKVEIATL